MMQCLFAIAGDLVCNEMGEFHIKRLVSDEIITTETVPVMLFSDISRRHSRQNDGAELVRPDHASGRFVQQFKFLRLSPSLNYEPIVMALKGLQLRFSPGWSPHAS